MSSSAAFRVVVGSMVCMLAVSATNPPSQWNDWKLSDVSHWSPQDLASRLHIIGNATLLSYVGTPGTYFHPQYANTSIPIAGWSRLLAKDQQLVPEGCGLRAVSFVNHAEGRLLVAFRGTDMNPLTASGQCDLCADQILWNSNTSQPLPPFCAMYPKSRLDYLGSARRLVANVSAAFPTYAILLTGHSLGAGIANVLAATVRGTSNASACISPNVYGAAVFSSPNFIYALRAFTSVDVTKAASNRIAVFADAYDPIAVAASRHLFGGIIGMPCVFNCAPPSAQCLACESTGNISFNNPDCMTCFEQRHEFSHYMKLIDNVGQCPPACLAAPMNQCPSEAQCPTWGTC